MAEISAAKDNSFLFITLNYIIKYHEKILSRKFLSANLIRILQIGQ